MKRPSRVLAIWVMCIAVSAVVVFAEVEDEDVMWVNEGEGQQIEYDESEYQALDEEEPVRVDVTTCEKRRQKLVNRLDKFVEKTQIETCQEEEVGESRKTAANIPAAILKRSGRIIVFYPPKLKSGGPAALHALHSTLNQLGFESYFYQLNPDYADEFSKPFPGPWKNNAFLPEDIVVVPEAFFQGRMPHDPRPMHEHLTTFGPARVVRWVLGLSMPIAKSIDIAEQSISIPVSFHVRDAAATMGDVIMTPLEPSFYQRPPQALKSKRDPSVGFQDEKENMVLIDNDFPFDPNQVYPLIPKGVKLVRFAGFNHDEVHQLYRKAKAVLDLYVPGAERMNFEASLYDCCVLVARTDNGQNDQDFPIADRFKVNDPANYTEIGSLITKAIEEYPTFVKEFHALKTFTESLPTMFDTNVARTFGSMALHFTVAAPDPSSEEAVVPLMITLFTYFPLATVEIFVRDVQTFAKNFERTRYLWLRYGSHINSVRATALSADQWNKYGPLAAYVAKPQWTMGRAFQVVVPAKTLFIGDEFVFELAHRLNSRLPKAHYANLLISKETLCPIHMTDLRQTGSGYWSKIARGAPTALGRIETSDIAPAGRFVYHLIKSSGVGGLGKDASGPTTSHLKDLYHRDVLDIPDHIRVEDAQCIPECRRREFVTKTSFSMFNMLTQQVSSRSQRIIKNVRELGIVTDE